MNRNPKPNPHENFIHPYVFILQEGHKINQDLLDYSLLMLQTNQSEVMKSPKRYSVKASSNPFVHLLKK